MYALFEDVVLDEEVVPMFVAELELDVVVATVEVVVEDIVDDPAVVVDVVEEVVVVETGPEAYILSRFGPPHNSVWLLLQAILQSEACALTEPAPRLLPQKHCPPYSTPEYLYPAQALKQPRTVSLDCGCTFNARTPAPSV